MVTSFMVQLEGKCYNFRIKELILCNQEYLDHICIIRNNVVFSCMISLLLDDTSLLLSVLIPFSQYK